MRVSIVVTYYINFCLGYPNTKMTFERLFSFKPQKKLNICNQNKFSVQFPRNQVIVSSFTLTNYAENTCKEVDY